MSSKGKAKFKPVTSNDPTTLSTGLLLADQEHGSESPSSDNVPAEPEDNSSSTFHLVRGFTRARGRIFSLDFTFDNLGLILPNGVAILQSVSARCVCPPPLHTHTHLFLLLVFNLPPAPHAVIEAVLNIVHSIQLRCFLFYNVCVCHVFFVWRALTHSLSGSLLAP